jgi:hypothetical protein
MGKIISGITDAVGLTDSKAGERAASASKGASQLQAGYQQDALDYMRESQAPFLAAQGGALGRLSSMAENNPYQQVSQQQMINQAMSSPLYSSIMQGQQAGEESILRNASATGGLRGGNTPSSLADFSSNLQNQALMQSYGQQQSLDNQAYNRSIGLEQTMLGLPTNTSQIANMTAGIGQTLGQGQIAAAQAQAAGSQQNTQTLMGLSSLGLGSLGIMFSDHKLKTNIIKTGVENGFNTYSWSWNEKAKELGLTGAGKGVIAQEVEKINPEAVVDYSGYKTVNYDLIGVQHA